jgi:hypothetical protein
MNTLAFHGVGRTATHARTARPVLRAGASILATIAALAALVALVTVVRVGIYALAHGGQPFFQTLVERLTS